MQELQESPEDEQPEMLSENSETRYRTGVNSVNVGYVITVSLNIENSVLI